MFMTISLLLVANLLMGIVAEMNIELSLLAISAIIVIICLFATFHPDGKRLEVIEK